MVIHTLAGAAALISSLPVTRANHSAIQASAKAKTTPATFGPMSRASLVKSRRNGSSSKTSKAMSPWDLPRSPQSLRQWATMQRRDSLQRERLARATLGAGSSFWPTPTAGDNGHFPDLKLAAGTVLIVKTHALTDASGGQIPLQNAARAWAQLWMAMQALGWQPLKVEYPSSHPVQVSFRSGIGSFQNGLISNPRFYDWMMGWPIGWTAPEEPVTAFAAWLRRSRIQHSKLISNANGGQAHD